MTARPQTTRPTPATSRDRQGAESGTSDLLRTHSLTIAARSGRYAALGMSLLDTSIAAAVISIVLFGLCGVSDSLVSDSADRQTSQVLRTLARALDAYHQAHDAWPSGSEPADIDTPMARCLAALRSSPATAAMVEDLPGQVTTDRGYLTLVDGFGRPMLYIHPADLVAQPDPAADFSGRFARPADGRPFIISAGRDGDFGDLGSEEPDDRAAAADNLDSL
jgi:type II secretory pathway pseudopilin PulG